MEGARIKDDAYVLTSLPSGGIRAVYAVSDCILLQSKIILVTRLDVETITIYKSLCTL